MPFRGPNLQDLGSCWLKVRAIIDELRPHEPRELHATRPSRRLREPQRLRATQTLFEPREPREPREQLQLLESFKPQRSHESQEVQNSRTPNLMFPRLRVESWHLATGIDDPSPVAVAS